MKKMFMLMMVVVVMVIAGPLQAAVLVYEPFDYAPVDDAELGAVDGKNGGVGFAGPWIDSTVGSNGGEAFVYDSAGNIYSGLQHPGLPDWDGVLDNLPQTGGYAGLSGYVGQYDDRMNCTRLLTQSASELAGTDGVLWASMAVHYVDTFGEGGVGFAFTDGAQFVERARSLSDSGSGIGLGNGTLSLWGNDLDTTFWAGGVEVAGDHITNVSRTQDNIVVIKFQFGETEDTVTTWYFTEDQEMTEAAFNANAAGTTSSIDESTLTTLAIGYIRAENGFDEIRIGDTFNDVIFPLTPVSPAYNALVIGGTDTLSWTNLDPNNPADNTYVDVWFGTAPNALTQVVTQQAVSTATVSTPTSDTYYWRVDSYLYGDPGTVSYGTNPGDPNVLIGSYTGLLQFEVTNDLPPENVDAGPNIETWANNPTELYGFYTDDGQSPVTVTWSADDPNAVFSPSSDGGVTGNTINTTMTTDYAARNVTVTLTVQDGFNSAVSDTTNVDVWGDACVMTRNNDGVTILGDTDNDCDVDLVDLANVAADWLLDYEFSSEIEL